MLRSSAGDLSGLEEKIVERAAAIETGIRGSFDQATTGKPVGGSHRASSETDQLYQQADPVFLRRMQSMSRFLSDAEKRSENTRSLRVGGFYVYPEVAPKDATPGMAGRPK